MGVLTNYPNAAAVNDALNKGVEANSAVGELKSDLSDIYRKDNIFDYENFTTIGGMPTIVKSKKYNKDVLLATYIASGGASTLFNQKVHLLAGKTYSIFTITYEIPTHVVFLALYRDRDTLATKQTNTRDNNVVVYTPTEDEDLYIGLWTTSSNGAEISVYFSLYIVEGCELVANPYIFSKREELRDVNYWIKKASVNPIKAPDNINFYQDNLSLQRILLNEPNLLFYDDFDGTSLNKCLWTIRVNGVNHYTVNNELQLYVSENVHVYDSMLCLTAKRTVSGDNTKWTSGRIDTQSKFEFGKGTRVEAKLKLPKVKGSWAAFWGLGSKLSEQYGNSLWWPVNGETDFLEQVDDTNTIHFNIWSYDGSKPVQKPSAKTIPDVSEWHIYAYENDGKYGRFYIDDELCYSVELSSLTHDNGFNPYTDDYNAQRIVLNLAVGGNMPSAPDDTTPDEFSMYVDYVKVTSLERPILINEVALLGTTNVNIGENTGYVLAKSTIGAQDRTISFGSNDESIAVVDNFGNISGVSSGICMIYAYSNSKIVGTIDITVNE